MASNPFAQYGMSDSEFARQLRESAEIDAGLNEFMAKEVVPALKGSGDTPVDTGKFAASIKITKKARRGRGEVGSRDYRAAFIEFGTGEPGPTRIYAPFQKTAARFGGDLDRGVDTAQDDQ